MPIAFLILEIKSGLLKECLYKLIQIFLWRDYVCERQKYINFLF
mgnify:CR=1